MIQQAVQRPVTRSSKPFCSALDHCALTDHGYIEEEIFFSGTANLYHTADDGQARVEYPDVPYTNRLIVRRPADQARFSGHVIVEILNATAHYDIERMWIVSGDYFMRHGIVYVGITSKPDVFPALKNYDASRYGALCWPNPRPAEQRERPVYHANRPSFLLEDQECGLFWDMLTESAELLRADDEKNPLRGWPVQYVTLTGWSQSSGYIARYINSFAYRTERARPVFDGYFAAGGVYAAAVPVNQNEYRTQRGPGFVRRVERPFVMLQTESENGRFGIMDFPRQNSDVPGRQCRIYEIAGSTHDYKQAMNDYYRNDPAIEGVNYPSVYRGAEKYPNHYPCHYPFNAAYHHFFQWVETGIAPAAAPLLMRNSDGSIRTDAFGNAVGGVRTALLDLPTRRYVPYSTWRREGKDEKNDLYGHEEPFSAAFLKELYGTLDRYEERVREISLMHVAQGFLLREEMPGLIREAVESARECGLK